MSLKRIEKITALAVKESGETDNVRLGEETLAGIMSLINDWTYIDTFGTDTLIGNVNSPLQGSITMLKNTNSALTDKTVLGGKAPDVAKFSRVSLKWGNPREDREGFFAYDLQRGLGQALAARMAKYVEEGRYRRETEGFREILGEDVKDADNTLSAADLADPQTFKRKIIEKCIEVSQTVDEEQGIKLIPRKKIIVHVSETDAYKLGPDVGNFAKESFETGIYYFNTIEGFKFYINPLLPQVDPDAVAIIGTTFSYKSFHSIIGAGAGVVPNSADQVSWYEDATAQGVIYDNTIKVLYTDR